MPFEKNDFIEVEFTGKVKDGEIFDSNVSGELKKLNSQAEAKPFILSLGNGMFLEGIENFLIGKEIGNYEIELKPENAFGFRNPNLIQKMPIKVFFEHKINPVPGAVFSFDNKIGKVLAVSGGRVMMDFNNPLAGKEVVYDIRILRKVENLDEKIKSLIEFLFKSNFNYKLEDKKIILEVDKGFKTFAELFKDKFKELFDLELEVEEMENPSKNNNNA
ncbi:MAG TPA: peptidylprolyl isomerase [Candidatus Pacearchaeota archaeon]|nr:peptidylprolyl isomerase [Candidatus Pacearchaeota archaeon]